MPFRTKVVALVAMLFLTLSHMAHADTSNTCKFLSGPRAGQIQAYPEATPIPVGSPCQDGIASQGIAIANDDTLNIRSPSSPSNLSTICQFTVGPRAGVVQDYAPMNPVPVGSSCQDGIGSEGIVIAVTSIYESNTRKTSTICAFAAGPRAGQQQDYAPLAAAPVGTPCSDGKGSFGVVVVNAGQAASSTMASTWCQFETGPRAGEKQNYFPMPAMPVGLPCQDGRGSTGIVVPK